MIYDISPPLTTSTKVWPGEPKLQQELISNMQKGDAVTVSILHCTAHIGAHADAPNHFVENAHSIGEADLEAYMGPCQVIEMECKPGEIIKPNMLSVPIRAERILIKTQSFFGHSQWVENFAALSPEFVDEMKQKEVKLIGIDTPSVDPFSSKTLEAHKRCFANGIAILEGLDLTNIPEGIYELIALPLKLINFDASPVRAILRDRV